GLIIGVAAALYGPVAILGALVAPEPVPGAGPWGGVGAGRVGFLVGLVLYAVVVSPIVTAAITFAIGEIYVGRSATVGQSLRVGASMLLPIAGTSILLGRGRGPLLRRPLPQGGVRPGAPRAPRRGPRGIGRGRLRLDDRAARAAGRAGPGPRRRDPQAKRVRVLARHAVAHLFPGLAV